jgi:hypothetical protein
MKNLSLEANTQNYLAVANFVITIKNRVNPNDVPNKPNDGNTFPFIIRYRFREKVLFDFLL